MRWAASESVSGQRAEPNQVADSKWLELEQCLLDQQASNALVDFEANAKIMEDPACLPTSICIICCDATLKQSAALLSAGYDGIYRASPLPPIALLLFDQCN